MDGRLAARLGVFSKVACLSSTFGWNEVDLVNEVHAWREPVPVKLHIDAGTYRDPRTLTQHMTQALEAMRYLFPWQSAKPSRGCRPRRRRARTGPPPR